MKYLIYLAGHVPAARIVIDVDASTLNLVILCGLSMIKNKNYHRRLPEQVSIFVLMKEEIVFGQMEQFLWDLYWKSWNAMTPINQSVLGKIRRRSISWASFGPILALRSTCLTRVIGKGVHKFVCSWFVLHVNIGPWISRPTCLYW